ncbi:MAG: hypothetical protein BWY74_00128 [Firmicutes bacterium ADurb.Bin419]|nr:MAG: hypothetical protein BWY74_00128 [Firmicutes bacterium ADurb.Bin419]
MKKTVTVLCCLAFIIGFASFRFIHNDKIIVSGQYLLKTKAELVDDSSVIIKGIVKEKLPSKWSNPNSIKGTNVRNTIQSDIIVDIAEVYKGEPYNRELIAVRVEKGKVNNIEVVSDGYPDFTLGEEVVLFLSEDDGDLANKEENYYVLTGMCQGKFSLIESNTNKIFKNNKGDEFKYTIKNEIENIIEENKKNPKPKMTKEEIREQNKKVFGDY